MSSPKLPIDLLNPRWAAIVGALRSEGTIHKDRNGANITNTSLEYLQNLKEVVDGLIGQVDPKITEYYKIPHKGKRRAYYLNLPFIFSDVLINGMGLKAGNKIISDAGLPSLYVFASKENPSQVRLVATMLRWLFSGDGWITVFRDHLGQTHRVIGIAFSKHVNNAADKSPPRLIYQTVYLLKKFFDIRVSGPYMDRMRSYMAHGGKRTTAHWRIFIRGYNNLKKFYENIGFVENRKNELLKNALNTYERPKLGDGESLETVLVIAKNMKCVTSVDIVKRTKMSLGWAERLLKQGREEGHLRLAGRRHPLRGRGAYTYKWKGD